MVAWFPHGCTVPSLLEWFAAADWLLLKQCDASTAPQGHQCRGNKAREETQPTLELIHGQQGCAALMCQPSLPYTFAAYNKWLTEALPLAEDTLSKAAAAPAPDAAPGAS